MQNLDQTLEQRIGSTFITNILIVANVLIFIAMLTQGAGAWHYVNSVQLDWGANFSPATQDGEWWRLLSAVFLHFSIIHLMLNMWSLWDAGQFVERMYGHARFACIYFLSGILGNLSSLIAQGSTAVSGGASGAIFGVIGALLVYLWANRRTLSLHEFRWMFWGAFGFAIVSITLGFFIHGIDNSAHIGGFVFGVLASIILLPTNTFKSQTIAAGMLATGIVLLIYAIPAPKYKWGDELVLRKQIDAFLLQDQAINRSWLEIVQASNQKDATFERLANQIENNIVQPYQDSFEKLSQLPANPALPSASKLSNLLQYTQQRTFESKLLAEKLRNQTTPPAN